MGPIRISVDDIKMPDIPVPDIHVPDIHMPDVVLPVFQPIDLLVILALIFGLAMGAHRGLVREVVGLGLVIGAYVFTNFSYDILLTGFESLTEEDHLARIFAYGTTFAALAAGMSITFHLVTKVVEVKEAAGLINRGGGALVGMAKLMLIACIGLFLIHADPDGREEYADSWFMVKLAPVWEPLSRTLANDLPDQPTSTADTSKKGRAKIQEQIDD